MTRAQVISFAIGWLFLGPAIAQPSDSPLLGTWTLVSYVAIASDNSVTYPVGQKAVGQATYSYGRMSVQIMPAGEYSGPALPWIRDGYLAYFGAYSVNLGVGSVTNQVEGSSYRPWVGSSQYRQFVIKGDELTFSVAAAGYMHRIAWKRVQ